MTNCSSRLAAVFMAAALTFPATAGTLYISGFENRVPGIWVLDTETESFAFQGAFAGSVFNNIYTLANVGGAVYGASPGDELYAMILLPSRQP